MIRTRGRLFHEHCDRIDDATTRVITQMDIDPEGFVENADDKLGILRMVAIAMTRKVSAAALP